MGMFLLKMAINSSQICTCPEICDLEKTGGPGGNNIGFKKLIKLGL